LFRFVAISCIINAVEPHSPGSKGKVTMKYIYLLAIIAILVSSAGCTLINNAPRHTSDEVITIAKGFNPQCRIQVASKQCG
ncbi:MAG: hypothetical protein JXB43_06890, partial [Dehalococcoidia bacterium]|nr:hypothetical protein [Dehalococcoidia bacterium]